MQGRVQAYDDFDSSFLKIIEPVYLKNIYI